MQGGGGIARLAQFCHVTRERYGMCNGWQRGWEGGGEGGGCKSVLVEFGRPRGLRNGVGFHGGIRTSTLVLVWTRSVREAQTPGRELLVIGTSSM